MIRDDLFQAVEKFVFITKDFDEADLEKPWGWRSYDREGVRFAFFRTYEELQELAVKLEAERLREGKPISQAQRILGQYHNAFRELKAVFLGTTRAIEDKPPMDGEWSVRRTLSHIVQADLGFYVVVKNALDNHRSGDARLDEEFEEAWKRISGLDEESFDDLMQGSVDSLLVYHDELHARVLRDFADIADEELELPSKYWESEAMSLRFRLHRFNSHMRQHTVQLEKAFSDLDHSPTEAERLLRFLYRALAGCESVMIGSSEIGEALRKEVVKSIDTRVDEIATIL